MRGNAAQASKQMLDRTNHGDRATRPHSEGQASRAGRAFLPGLGSAAFERFGHRIRPQLLPAQSTWFGCEVNESRFSSAVVGISRLSIQRLRLGRTQGLGICDGSNNRIVRIGERIYVILGCFVDSLPHFRRGRCSSGNHRQFVWRACDRNPSGAKLNQTELGGHRAADARSLEGDARWYTHSKALHRLEFLGLARPDPVETLPGPSPTGYKHEPERVCRF